MASTGEGHDATGHHGHGAATPRSAYAERLHADMARMMESMHAAGASGDADVDFLAMMIPHHQGAIDMARLLLEHGTDPLTRRLAEELIASQAAEIAAMQARLDHLRERGRTPEYPALGGTRG